ncbi:MAG: hypothetical protein A2X49_15475 [Lentisphaerae bacterium GWF2_52_8]|nr:MAG: hypothetical protein A2X49_15475 [Lentisphaerae bacterium GWF2_52_8]
MRYRENGELHLDFHGASYVTIKFILERFGNDALRQVLKKMAKEVYYSIYERLKKGDTSELIEHWQHFLSREKGDFELHKHDDGTIELELRECPAVRQLKVLGLPFDPNFCLQTQLLNEAWSEDTPFEIVTEKTGEGSCRQLIYRKDGKYDSK